MMKKQKYDKKQQTQALTKMQMEALKRACKEFEFHVWTCDRKITY